MEIELKLTASPADLRRVGRHPAVTRRAQGRSRSTPVYSVYLDTPDLDLRRHDVALRLRREGRRWIQTVKGREPGSDNGANDAAGGLHRREEFEWRVPAARIDLSLLAATPFRKLFAKSRIRDHLAPVFTTSFRRTSRMLEFDDGSVAELCLDRGELRAGDGAEPINEMEIELKRGEPSRLIELALELQAGIDLGVGYLSKAERGYALHAGTPAPPHKGEPAQLPETISGDEAARRIASRCMGQMQANQAGFLGAGDPEYLHQLRVGQRRLRAALVMLRDEAWKQSLAPLKPELKWISTVLGEARDWDVFVAEVLPPLAAHFPGDPRIRQLRLRCQRLRRGRLDAARKAVRSPRYQRLLLSLGLLLLSRAGPGRQKEEGAGAEGAEKAGVEADGAEAEGVVRFARAVLARQERKLRKLGEGLARADAGERHRTRIAVKKLRYSVWFFAPLFRPARVRRYLKPLERLQTLLGAINDAVSAAAMLQRATGARGGARAAHFAGLVRGWIAAGEASAIAQLGSAWDDFAKRKKFW